MAESKTGRAQDPIARSVAPLRHENIVSIYAAGKNGPYCWVAMEYVEGENLADVIDCIGRYQGVEV